MALARPAVRFLITEQGGLLAERFSMPDETTPRSKPHLIREKLELPNHR
jgi:hypothetical protein